MQRARDRRGGEREHVDLEPERAQQLLLRDAEALLLVEDDEAEVLRDHVAARAPGACRSSTSTFPSAKSGEHLLRLGRPAEARDHLDADREVAVALPERVPVLLGEDRRRAEDERLLAVDGGGEGGADRDLGLAEADVAADEPVHRPRRLEVLLHRLDRARLILGLAVGELRLEPLEPLVLERRTRRPAPAGAARRGRSARRRARARDSRARAFRFCQALPPSFESAGALGVGADVLRDLAELLVRDVEPVVAAEGEEEVVARDAGDLLRLEAEQLADPVVLVDDEVAGAQVGERGERAAEPRSARGGRLRKTCVSGRSTSPSSRQTKPRRAGATAKSSSGSSGSSSPAARIARLDSLAAGCCVPQRLPACGKATTTRLPPRTKPFSSFSASASPRAAIAGRCASNENGWPCGNGSSSDGPVERDRVEALLRPHAPHLVRLPDEVGRAVEQRHEVVRDLGDRRLRRPRRRRASARSRSAGRSAAG